MTRIHKEIACGIIRKIFVLLSWHIAPNSFGISGVIQQEQQA
jgi:hypothetical protein